MTNATDYDALCDASLPHGMNISRGTAFATCDFCSFKCAYWECPCELVHECEGN